MLTCKNEISIEFAQEFEFKEILNKIHLFFEKEDGFFASYVPTLYKEGINTYKNHIVAKHNGKIVGVLAFVKKELIALNSSFNLMVIGSVSVDKDYRKLGIMTNMFDLLYKTYDKEIDVYSLFGNIERYKYYGFTKSDESKLFVYKGKDFGYKFVKMDESNYKDSLTLFNTLKYRVNRDKLFLDSLSMWYDVPYVIYKDDKYIGYLSYNPRNNRVEEHFNIDKTLTNDIMQSFALFQNKEVPLKITKQNFFMESKLKHIIELKFIDERSLCRILNPKLEGLYVPRHDLI